MIDVKKLITGFLILAVAAVCSGLIFSLVNFLPSATSSGGQQITIAGGNTTGTSENAFLPTEEQVQQVVAALAPDVASSSMMVSSTNPNNLTDALATEFVNGVVAANPNGPTTDSPDGNAVISTPNVTAVAANVADTPAIQDLQIPNWDAEAASIPVAVITSNSSSLTNYGNAMMGILSDHLNSQVQNIVSNQNAAVDPTDISYLESQIQETLQDTASLKTPTAAEAYQKSLLDYLVYQKNMVQLYTLAQTDPVKASLIFQQEDSKFSSVKQNFLDQAQNLESNTLSLQQTVLPVNDNLLLSFVNNTFGISQAHALWPVFDPATWALIGSDDATQIGDQLEAMLKNTLLQILKNTLMALVQQKVLTWVQGSGAPRFITNWGTQLVNAAQMTALNAINAQISCGVYPAFASQLKVTLNAFYKPGGNSCANQFAAALGSNSFQQFYNNFTNGGFVAFGASTLPSGNPYGSLFFNAQSVNLAYTNQQSATALQTQTSGGFKGSQACDDGSDPNNGEHTVCENPDGPDYTIQGSEQCGSGDTPVVYANQGTCSDGTQPIVTTPSAVTGFALNTAVDGTSQQIAAANDIIGLLNSVLSSLLTSLASTAVNSANLFVSQQLAAANQGLTSISPLSITNGTTSTPPASIPLTCNPSTQTIPSALSGAPSSTGSTATSTAPFTVSAAGGTLDANDNPPLYYWSDTNGVTSTGSIFSDTFTVPGTYTVTLGDSTGDASTTCTVIQQ